ncbi:hypothetical protein BJ684DRAFT_14632 [Piptocephalis cylindrospora]|uniref:Myb-like domain-containing protein n=1 Tax=Piptocephalis cylindrospora TaxID=1907219 RepID=A0A4P9Y8F9_9FUNG|nr:hypothetical protein BJ684DRAFT_14632 [Piptocephalis cylindrospora]|eukprot:RKP15082.1 hypothetical protein BJ684DRAFT_14632 [Piptocephalis cylindrospora]
MDEWCTPKPQKDVRCEPKGTVASSFSSRAAPPPHFSMKNMFGAQVEPLFTQMDSQLDLTLGSEGSSDDALFREEPQDPDITTHDLTARSSATLDLEREDDSASEQHLGTKARNDEEQPHGNPDLREKGKGRDVLENMMEPPPASPPGVISSSIFEDESLIEQPFARLTLKELACFLRGLRSMSTKEVSIILDSVAEEVEESLRNREEGEEAEEDMSSLVQALKNIYRKRQLAHRPSRAVDKAGAELAVEELDERIVDSEEVYVDIDIVPPSDAFNHVRRMRRRGDVESATPEMGEKEGELAGSATEEDLFEGDIDNQRDVEGVVSPPIPSSTEERQFRKRDRPASPRTSPAMKKRRGVYRRVIMDASNEVLSEEAIKGAANIPYTPTKRMTPLPPLTFDSDEEQEDGTAASRRQLHEDQSYSEKAPSSQKGRRIPFPIQPPSSSSPRRNQRKRTRLAWTPRQTDCLEKGMEEYGTSWAAILSRYGGTSGLLAGKTQVQLKDKARNERKRRVKVAFHFPDGQGPLPQGRHFQILNTLHADGGFLVHALLAHAVQAGQPTVLFSCTHPWSHYANIGRKLTVPLVSAQEKGDLVLVDGRAAHIQDMSGSIAIDQLFQEFSQRILSQKASSKPPCLILDDVDTLLDLGTSPESLCELLDACVSLMNQVNGVLISRWRTDEALLTDQEGGYDRCLRQAVHRADILLTVQALSSGKARDVDGQLTLTRGPRNMDGWFQASTWHYHLSDGDVQLFPQGMSSGVL